MAFQSILDQDEAADFLRAAARHGRLSHAYLFAGPDGVGKARFARETAKFLLCPNASDDACDQCRSCRQAEGGNHPDIFEVVPPEGKRAILIKQVREELLRHLHLTPVQSAGRVAIVHEAHLMAEPAANAMLKILEEPPDGTTLILVSSSAETLLPTIRSRCQLLRFRPLAVETVRAILKQLEQLECDPGQIECAAQLADGSAGRAVRLIETGCLALREELVGYLATLSRRDNFVLAARLCEFASEQGAGSLETQRRVMRDVLALIIAYYRDLLALSVNPEARPILNADQLSVLQPQAARLGATRVRHDLETILDARRAIDQNVQMQLLLENLFLDLAA